MSFSTYWDLQEKDRAALTEADVQRYVDAELMLKGVLKVEAPAFDLEPEEPHIPTRTYYKLHGFDAVFETADAAATLAALKPLSSNYQYLSGFSDSLKYVERERRDLQVVPIQLAEQDAVIAAKAELERCSAAKSANAKRREEYQKAVKLQNDALSGMWEDWHAQRRATERHKRVVETFESYVSTAGGDREVAAKFLLKVFTPEQVGEASEWTGVPIPGGFAEVDPGPSHPDAAKPSSDDDIVF